MNDIFSVIFELNPKIFRIVGNVAYDKDKNEVSYDMEAAQAKFLEMQEAELKAWQDKDMAKQSALAKLAKLGLTQDEIAALL